jgi:hypothetical protein
MSLLVILPRETAVSVLSTWWDVFILPHIDSAFCAVTYRRQLLAYFESRSFGVRSVDGLSFSGLFVWMRRRHVKLKELHVAQYFDLRQQRKFFRTMDRFLLASLTIVDQSTAITRGYSFTESIIPSSHIAWFSEKLLISIVNTSPQLTALHLIGPLAHLTDRVFINMKKLLYGQLSEVTLIDCESLTDITLDLITRHCINLTEVDISLSEQNDCKQPILNRYAASVAPMAESLLTEDMATNIIRNNNTVRQLKFLLNPVSELLFNQLIDSDNCYLTNVCFNLPNVSMEGTYLRQVITFLLKYNSIQYAMISFRDRAFVKVTMNKIDKV